MQEFFEKNKRGIIGTTIFHLVVVLIILFLGFSTPLPIPGEEGIIINFGTDEDGFGITQAAQQATPPPPAARPAPRTEEEERILTQDIEEAPSLPTPQRQEQRQPEPEQPQPVADPTPEPVVAEAVPEAKPEPVPERRPNPNALFPGRTTTGDPGSNEGETTGPGNQGRVTGSADSPHRMGGDTGSPDGISYSLDGRNPLALPLPAYNHQVEGRVVVEVTVDRNGYVTSARAGVQGSTIQNINLLNAAKSAAEKARFNVSQNSPAFQVGTITYLFRLQ